MSFTLIRHTHVAVKGLCYGRSDVPLAESFLEEAAVVQAALTGGSRRWFSSPSERCLRLARILCAEVEIDERLCELNFGEWEMRPWNALPRGELDSWGADFVQRGPPGGESFAQLAKRAMDCVADIGRRFPEENVVAVTHAGVIRALLAQARGLSLTDSFSIEVLPGGVYPYR